MTHAGTLLFIIDPLSSLNPKKDSTIAMMEAAQKRGIKVGVIEDGGLAWSQAGGVTGEVKWVHVDMLGHPWWMVLGQTRLPLKSAGAVVMRKDPPFDAEFVAATWLLEQAEREGAVVLNKPSALRDHNEKFSIAQFQAFTVPTMVTRNPQDVRDFMDTHPLVILKPLDGMGGESIFRLQQGDPNIGVILETVTRRGQRTVMVQRYIPEIADGDKRVLLIAGEPVPYALARLPKAGEHRGNLAAGGTARAQNLSARDLEIATTLGPVLFARGLFLVGLDVIGENLTEVNVTSPTCFREIEMQTGFDVAGLFIDKLTQLPQMAGRIVTGAA
jgi:glutathione synthase